MNQILMGLGFNPDDLVLQSVCHLLHTISPYRCILEAVTVPNHVSERADSEAAEPGATGFGFLYSRRYRGFYFIYLRRLLRLREEKKSGRRPEFGRAGHRRHMQEAGGMERLPSSSAVRGIQEVEQGWHVTWFRQI
jgi:hypothetical protein